MDFFNSFNELLIEIVNDEENHINNSDFLNKEKNNNENSQINDIFYTEESSFTDQNKNNQISESNKNNEIINLASNFINDILNESNDNNNKVIEKLVNIYNKNNKNKFTKLINDKSDSD